MSYKKMVDKVSDIARLEAPAAKFYIVLDSFNFEDRSATSKLELNVFEIRYFGATLLYVFMH